MKDAYCFGECKICKKVTALKNGYCAKCKMYDVTEMPDIFKDIFYNFPKDKK